jgi:septum formation protein
MANPDLKLILASTSPRRRELLGHLKIPFEVMSMNVPEDSTEANPVEFCRELAHRKGRAVANKLQERDQKHYLIVSADTIVSLGNKIYNKPADRHEAREFLSELAGKTHSVFTAVGLTLIYQNNIVEKSFVDESRVTFAPIPTELMERYLDTGDSLDKAGAYGIQGPSLTFISKVEGSYSTVVGFPLSRFVTETEKFLTETISREGSWFTYFQY